MKNQRVMANAILWAAAIIASALLDAPSIVCQILLPALAVLSMQTQSQKSCLVRRSRP
jgi:hypothetical protein